MRLKKQIAQQRHLGSNIEKLRDTQTEVSDEFNQVQARYYSLGAEIAKIEQNITHHKERYQQLQEDKIQVEQSTTELQQNTQVDQQRLSELQQELTKIEPQFNRAKETHAQSLTALAAADNKMTTWQQQWDQFVTATAQAVQTAEVEQARLQHSEQLIKDINSRIEKLDVEMAVGEQGGLDVEIEQLDTQQQQAQAVLDKVMQELAVASNEIIQLREKNDVVNNKIDNVKETLQEAKGRYASLTALQQAALGTEDENIIAWLTKHNIQQQPRLVEQLQVVDGWEKAVEMVLGIHLQAICVDDYHAAEQLLNDVPAGLIEFFVNTTATGVNNVAADQLLDKVNVNKNTAHLFENIYCADSLVTAKKMMTKLESDQSVVTKDGIWLSKQWLRVAKDKDKQSGVLQRKRQLQQLSDEIKTLEVKLEQLLQKITQNKQEIDITEERKEILQQQNNEALQAVADLGAQYQVKQQLQQQFQQRAKQLIAEQAEQQAKLKQYQQQLVGSRDKWQHASRQQAEHVKQKTELTKIGEQYREHLNKLREQMQADANNKHQLEVRVAQLKPQITTLEENINRAAKQLQSLFARSTSLAESLDNGEMPVTTLQAELEQILSQRVAVEHELAAVRKKVETINHQIRELEQQKEVIAQQVDKMRHQLEEQRLEGRTVEVRKKTYVEQLAEIDYQLNLVLNELPEDATITAWEETAQLTASRIARLGAINLAAIDEYQVQEERKQYLDHQYDDLMEALTTLENAIRKIDKETRARFKETFDKVNDGFKNLFPRVFGGGSAYLELTGEDLLDTGISVMARPPGKRNTTIHLLSGGEKALTAVALVFAIFHLNPAPFCLLDEVDAPLDDANVGRFCSLVKEMSNKVQFLFISHNKLAIEMANQLTGITMHEPGVSRVVAVDVEEAVQLAVA